MVRLTPRRPLPLFYNDHFKVPLPPNHRFPMAKYGLVRHGLQRELEPLSLATFHESPLATLEELKICHTSSYVENYVHGRLTDEENRRVGFPWSTASVNRSLSSTGGTIAATRAVCEVPGTSVAGHLAGGTHHAFADRGEGYCVFNDIAVAALVALRDYPDAVSRVLIVDLDVHQGNGCAVIFADEPRVTTLSVHCGANYFSARQRSDVDIEVPDGAGDDEYLQLLRLHLPPLFEATRPQLTFFQAGVDPHEQDAIGRLRLSSAGLKRRNKLVFDLAAKHRTKMVVTMGGGYPRNPGRQPLEQWVMSAPFHAVVQCHMDVYRAAAAANARGFGASTAQA